MHESLRLFVAGVRKGAGRHARSTDDSDMPFIALINPEIVPVGADIELGWEGCLSIPDIRGQVPRPQRGPSPGVRSDRPPHRVRRATGLPARVIQHETDHLDGVLFFDRMTSFESLAFMDEFRRYWAKDDDEDDDGVTQRVHRRPKTRRRSRRTSRTSTGRCSRSSTCRRRSRARCSRATRDRRSRCGGCSSTSFYERRRRRDAPTSVDVGAARAERLYQRVFNEYGDDSVAQLGGVHLAVEDASNILTKVLERGRLMAYLEQSTRYIPYTERRGDAWRYLVPAELDGHPLRAASTSRR